MNHLCSVIRGRRPDNLRSSVSTSSTTAARAPSFMALLKVSEFRWLWLAECQSTAGDQLARVALSVLVFARTGSAIATAGTYALTFVPALLGGALLSGIADRYPRRTVMVTVDVLRAVLLGLMAVPGIPLAVLAAIVVIAVLVGTPFTAAQGAVLPAILEGEQYVTGQALRNLSGQAAQLLGFAGGGAVVAAVGTRPALVIDAVTFVVSAAVLRLRLAPYRPLGRTQHLEPHPRGLGSTLRLLSGTPRLRAWLLLAWLIGFYVVVEGVAVPLAHQLNGGALLAGVLMAASPAGTAVGAVIVGRFLTPSLRARLVVPSAIGSGVALTGFALDPGASAAVALLFGSGLLGAYLIHVTATFTRSVPDSIRGQAVAIASSGLLVAQGLALLGGGILGESIGSAHAIAVAGACGAVCAAVVGCRQSEKAAR